MDVQTTAGSNKVHLIITAALGTEEEATNNSSQVMEDITSSIAADKETVATMAEATEADTIKDDMGTSSSTKMEGGELAA